MPAVSVVLTSYNQGRWLRQSVESVLGQTCPDWELILVDNGSTDGSAGIAESYRTHPKVTVIRYERNSPHTIISNDAIRRARGRFVSFLYSDDYYLPAKLERQLAVFEDLSDRYGVVYSSGYRLLPDGTLLDIPCAAHAGSLLKSLLTEPQFFLPISPLVRRECLLRYPFNEAIFMEGEGIFSKVALGYHFYPLREPLVVMRDHEDNMGKEIGPNLERNVLMVNAIFDHPEFPAELAYVRGRLLGRTYGLAGWQVIRRERNYRRGRSWIRAAMAANPRLIVYPRVVAGLLLSVVPRALADQCQDLLNRKLGTPPPPNTGLQTPVTGRRPAEPRAEPLHK